MTPNSTIKRHAWHVLLAWSVSALFGSYCFHAKAEHLVTAPVRRVIAARQADAKTMLPNQNAGTVVDSKAEMGMKRCVVTFHRQSTTRSAYW